LLLEVLSREGFSYRAVLERVESKSVPDQWKIVCLYPKEREMKPDARMFAIMVFEMRALFSGLEANLADKVFPYLSAQTMTKSKQKIQELFYGVTEDQSSDDNLHVFLECDLSRWNLRMRADAVEPIAHDINHLFGLHHSFSYVHQFFSESVIVVRTPKLPPQMHTASLQRVVT